MAFVIPTTKDVKDQNLANLESNLNQTSPLADKAFLRVLAAMEALQTTPLYKYAAERALQNLAISATGEDLDRIGLEFNVIRKPAEATQLEISLPATDGTVIPATISHIGDNNGERYFAAISVIATGSVAVIDVTAENTGVSGNLQVGETLSISSQVPGAETVSTITSILNTGAEKETDNSYRLRVLDAIRQKCGGGNTADYRTWAQEVAGVARAYPFAGKPVDSIEDSNPPDRTVYVEADTSIDPDGIAPQSLLDEVRASITADPNTGITRQPLGLTDETLFVESIIRTTIFTEIRGLDVAIDQVAQAKVDIESALDTYYLSLEPFVSGLDPTFERNDLITDLTVSEVVQNVVSTYGGSATGVGFGLVLAVFLPSYTLDPNEKTKAGTITYV